MKYIRTKDGIYRIYNEALDDMAFQECYVGGNRVPSQRFVDRRDIVSKADTIKELCDVAVVIKNGTKYVCGILHDDDEDDFYVLHDGDSTTFKAEECDEVYGAIWTEKGLIYVAKLNKKGEWELL